MKIISLDAKDLIATKIGEEIINALGIQDGDTVSFDTVNEDKITINVVKGKPKKSLKDKLIRMQEINQIADDYNKS